MQNATISVDASALTEPVDRQAAIDFETSIQKDFGLESAHRDLADVVVRGFFVGIGASLLALAAVVLVTMNVLAFVQQSTQPQKLDYVLVVYPPLAVVAITLAIVLRVRAWKRNDPTTRRYRLDRFARDNGWSYTPVVHTLVRPGMMFDLGTTRMTYDMITRDEPRRVEIGDHKYHPSALSKTVERRGYIGIRLDAALPHIVLDSTANDFRSEGSSLRFRVDPDQRLSLEGDFDTAFTLYCPAGYERDALYLFTPDIMARFVDLAADFDVEIADDWLMLSTRDTVATLDREKWRGRLELVAALEQKLGQWARWRDTQTLAPGGEGSARSAGARASDGAAARVLRPLAPLDSSGPQAHPDARVAAPARVAKAGRRLGSRRFRWAPVSGFIIAMALLLGPLLLAQILFG